MVVNDLNLSVKSGEVFGFLGPNGAGKTTTVRMLTCLIGPSSGTAYVDGLDISKAKEAMQIRSRVGLLTETPGMYDTLSAYKNLQVLRKAVRRRRAEARQPDRALPEAAGTLEQEG